MGRIINQDLKEGRLVKILDKNQSNLENLYILRLSRRFTPAKVRFMVDHLKKEFAAIKSI